jgi:hypothetical protein
MYFHHNRLTTGFETKQLVIRLGAGERIGFRNLFCIKLFIQKMLVFKDSIISFNLAKLLSCLPFDYIIQFGEIIVMSSV